MPPSSPRRTAVAAVALGAVALIAIVAFLVGRSTSHPATTTAGEGSSSVVSVSRVSSTSAASGSTNRTTTSSTAVPVGLKTIARADLPPEARATLDLIARGGPFPYKQDGVVFQNREGVLPKERSGYYHEYTVKTPGSADRGARRIIVGGRGEQLYTDDHYVSFRQIVSG